MSEKNFVILGMHRSATSLVAKALVDQGWYYRGELIRDKNNPWGYYEDYEIVQLNDSILRAAGGSWHDPPDEEKIESLRDLFEPQIKYLFQRRYVNSGWVIKEPRLCLTFPLWEKFFGNAILLFIKRDRQEVLDSLLARESPGLTKEQLEHTIDIYYKRLADIANKHYNIVYEDTCG